MVVQVCEELSVLLETLLERFRGHEVDTAGDGFFATFDGPTRGIRCALTTRDRRTHELKGVPDPWRAFAVICGRPGFDG